MQVPSRLNEYPVGITRPTVCRDAPADSSFVRNRGSTVSDDDVPRMISNSSLISRISLNTLNPAHADTEPRTTTMKIAQVPQNVTINRPRLASDDAPNAATVNAMPPNAASGAAHMMILMMPKITLAMPSMAATARSRIRVESMLIEQAVRIASTSTCSTLLSTKGCRKLVGNSSFCRNADRPVSSEPVSTDLFAASSWAWEGCPWNPAPGCTRWPASRPRNSAMTVATKK